MHLTFRTFVLAAAFNDSYQPSCFIAGFSEFFQFKTLLKRALEKYHFYRKKMGRMLIIVQHCYSRDLEKRFVTIKCVLELCAKKCWSNWIAEISSLTFSGRSFFHPWRDVVFRWLKQISKIFETRTSIFVESACKKNVSRSHFFYNVRFFYKYRFWIFLN